MPQTIPAWPSCAGALTAVVVVPCPTALFCVVGTYCFRIFAFLRVYLVMYQVRYSPPGTWYIYLVQQCRLDLLLVTGRSRRLPGTAEGTLGVFSHLSNHLISPSQPLIADDNIICWGTFLNFFASYIPVYFVPSTCMRRPGWYPRAWSSWHLQVLSLHLKSWTSVSASFSFCYINHLYYMSERRKQPAKRSALYNTSMYSESLISTRCSTDPYSSLTQPIFIRQILM